MKTKILIPIILAFLISCKDDPIKNQKSEFSKLSLNYLNNKIKESGSPDVIDSLKLIKVDSVTEAHEVLFLTNFINSKFKKFNSKQEEILNDMKLYSAIGANDLIEIKHTDFEKERDSFKFYSNIFEKIKNRNSDSIKVLNYYTTFLSKSHNLKTNEARQDSIYIIFNNQNQIITENEYIKQLISKFSK